MRRLILGILAVGLLTVCGGAATVTSTTPVGESTVTSTTRVGNSTLTTPTASMEWGEEALAWRQAEIEASREGVWNLVQFWDDDIVADYRNAGLLLVGIPAMLSEVASAQAPGEEFEEPELLGLFLSADEELNQYDTNLDRQRVGPDGDELIVGAGSAQEGYAYPEWQEQIDAALLLVDRYVAYWNGSNGGTAEDLYADDAVIDDTLFGESVQGTEAIAAAAGSGDWPDLAPMTVATIPHGGGPAVFGGELMSDLRPFRPSAYNTDLDELHVVLEVDDGTGCPGLLGVALGFDTDRVVWERRYHEVESVRQCFDTDLLQPGWWEGLEVPNPLRMEHTSTMTWAAKEITVEIFNGVPGVEDFVRWGLQRFDQAGLSVPNVGSVTFLNSRSKCQNYFGFATTNTDESISSVAMCNQADQICEDASCDTWKVTSRVALLHEYAHVWISQNVDEETRTQFLDLIDVPNWTDPDIRHSHQGTEYAANTIVYGLLDDDIPPLIATDWTCQQREQAFTLLTGAAPISPCQP